MGHRIYDRLPEYERPKNWTFPHIDGSTYWWRFTLQPKQCMTIHECDTRADPSEVLPLIRNKSLLFRFVLVDENTIISRISGNPEVIHWLPISNLPQKDNP
jgi:hypothetical protein